MTRYLSGLCVAGLGLCGGGWLVVAAVAFGGTDGGDAEGQPDDRRGADRGRLHHGGGLGDGVAARMRADGVLGERFVTVSRRQARRNRRELTRDVRRAARTAKPRHVRQGSAPAAFPGWRTAGSRTSGWRATASAVVATGGGLGGGGLGAGCTGGQRVPGSGLSGGGLGEPRGWIGGAGRGTRRTGPRAAARDRQARAPWRYSLSCVRLRALLTPLLEAAGKGPVPPPLPQRQPGQERPGIPCQRAEQARQAEPAGLSPFSRLSRLTRLTRLTSATRLTRLTRLSSLSRTSRLSQTSSRSVRRPGRRAA